MVPLPITFPPTRKALGFLLLLVIAAFIYSLSDPNTSLLSVPHSHLPPHLATHAAPATSWSSWRLSPSLWLPKPSNSYPDLTGALQSGTTGEPESWQSPTASFPLNASLADRLHAWRTAPLPEPALWVQFNLRTCPDARVGKNSNVNLLGRAHLMWATMNRKHYHDKRMELINFLQSVSKKGFLAQRKYGSGRGIVFTAGNADTFSRVFLAVRMLREKLECQLPIEIFSFPGESPTDELRKSFEAHRAIFKVIKWAQKDSHRSKNFHIKASALITSSFREPLYLDSDNLPAMLNPGDLERLWESKGYQKLGAVFWPDYWKTHADVPIWLLIGTQCRDEWEQEAGQILIDKSRHLDVLLLSDYMLRDWRYWFQISDGDKDVFRYAMLALRKRWAVPGRFLGAAGLSWNTPSGFCGHTMLQHDIEGRPLFVHMNLLKQIPSGITRGTTFKRTRNTNIHILGNETVEDWGVEADMLANADVDGHAISDAPAPVRRRAAVERGLIPFLHGGFTSAVCADVKWEDPRTEDEKTHSPQHDIQWSSPLEIAQWDDDSRLAGFEERFFEMGGRTNSAAGF